MALQDPFQCVLVCVQHMVSAPSAKVEHMTCGILNATAVE